MKLIFKIIILLLPAVAYTQEIESAAAALARDVDILWVSLSAALVFFMQAGFLMLEAGLVRAKNTINVAIKNIVDFITGTIGFYIIGFGLMFGASLNGVTGTTHFMLHGIGSGKEYAFFLFQVAFMGTAATIVSGAVAERIKFSGYVISSLVISVLIYPIFGHWAWGGGWLAETGFIDFAGSTVVHSVGGWVGLAGIIVLGPRHGKFDEHGKPREMYGHNLTLSVLGALILWFGWYGFNGGSTLAVTDGIPLILVNTTLSASAGGLTAMALSWYINRRRSRVEDIINGVIGGLVGITAGCHLSGTNGALAVGAVCGIIAVTAPWIMENIFRLDDVVGAFPVHALCGAWGTLAIPLIAAEPGTGGSFIIQLTGVASCFAWSFGLGYITFYLLKIAGKLRVPPESESKGLNLTEHGAKTSWLDLITAMARIADKKGMPGEIEPEPETESGMIAGLFNKIISNFNEVLNKMKINSIEIEKASITVKKSSGTIHSTIITGSGQIQEITSALEQIKETFSRTSDKAKIIMKDSKSIFSFSQEILEGFNSIEQELKNTGKLSSSSLSLAHKGEEELKHTVSGMEKISRDSQKVKEILNFLEEISDRLNMLSLNASIEAARSGIHGRGFSIVAGEMNKLAEITRSKTKEAAIYISEMKSSVTEGKSMLSSSVEIFGRIKNHIAETDKKQSILISNSRGYMDKIDSINGLLKSLAHNSDDIANDIESRGIELSETYNAVNDINEGIAGLQMESEKLNNTSLVMNSQSERMKEAVMDFNPEPEEAEKGLLN